MRHFSVISLPFIGELCPLFWAVGLYFLIASYTFFYFASYIPALTEIQMKLCLIRNHRLKSRISVVLFR